jgi:hypothetical protein
MFHYAELKKNLQLLAIARIVLFGTLFCFYASYLPLVPQLYSRSLSPNFVVLVYGLLIAHTLLACVGRYFRFASIIVLVCHIILLLQNHMAFSGWAFSLPLVVILISLSPADSLMSLRKSARRLQPRSMLPFYLLFTYASMIYFVVNIYRARQLDWLSGAALENLLSSSLYSRFAHIDFSAYSGLFRIISWLGWGLEILGVFLFFIPWPKIRKYLCGSLIALHLVIFFSTRVQFWSLLSIALLILGFGHFPWDRCREPRNHIIFFASITFFLCLSLSSIGLERNLINPSLVDVLLPKIHSLFPKVPALELYKVDVYTVDNRDGRKLIYSTPPHLAQATRFQILDDKITAMLEKAQVRKQGGEYLCLILQKIFNVPQREFYLEYTWRESHRGQSNTEQREELIAQCPLNQ